MAAIKNVTLWNAFQCPQLTASEYGMDKIGRVFEYHCQVRTALNVASLNLPGLSCSVINSFSSIRFSQFSVPLKDLPHSCLQWWRRLPYNYRGPMSKRPFFGYEAPRCLWECFLRHSFSFIKTRVFPLRYILAMKTRPVLPRTNRNFTLVIPY